MVERDHRRAARGDACDLDRVLDRLGAGVDEQRLRLRLTGPRLAEQATHLDVRLVHPDHEALVQVPVDLLVDGVGREAVTGVLAPEPAGEVDVLASVDVPHARPLRPRDDARRGGDPAGDVPLARRDDPFRLGALLDGHGYFFRSARISDAARTPSDAPPSMNPWKSCEQCSPAKWTFPCRIFS